MEVGCGLPGKERAFVSRRVYLSEKRKPEETHADASRRLYGVARSFAWKVPDRYNIGVDVCDRHADDPGRVALIVEEEDGTVRRHTFARSGR